MRNVSYFDRSEPALRAALLAHPAVASGYADLGALLFEQQRFVEAQSLLEKAVSLNPAHAAAWCTLGAVYESAGRLEEAWEVLRKATQLAPRLAQAWLNLGYVAMRRRDYAGARRAFTRMTRLQPADVRGWQGACAAALKLGLLAEAGQALQHARERGLPDEPWHRLQGMWLWACGHLPDAVGAFRSALQARLAKAQPVVQLRPPAAFPPGVDVAQVLWTVLRALHQVGVHAMPFAGTLLGWEREGALLPFDKDLDIALPEDELDAAAQYLQAHGWVRIVQVPALHNPLSFWHALSGVTVDMIALRADGDGWLSGTWQADIPWEWQRLTRYPRFGWAQRPSPLGPVWWPDQPQAVLDTVYGDWRTPDPDFDSIVAARNLQGYSALTQCHLFSRILQRWGFGQYAKALANVGAGLQWLPDDALLQALHTRLQEVCTAQHPRNVSP